MEKNIPLWPSNEKVDAPWIASPRTAIAYALSLAKVREWDSFADIGCGDRRAAIMASKYFKAKSTCIELREDLCALSYANAIYNNVSDKFSLICQDARKVVYNEFDVVYIYMFPTFIEEISKKLDEEMRLGSRLITLDFPVKNWIPILMRRFQDEVGISRSIFLYLTGISNPSSWRLKKFYGYPRI